MCYTDTPILKRIHRFGNSCKMTLYKCGPANKLPLDMGGGEETKNQRLNE